MSVPSRANVLLPAIALCCALLLNSCATVFKGSTEKVNFSTDPTGAKVYINGQYFGQTPLELNMLTKKTYDVEFRKEGYRNRTVALTHSVGGGWLVVDIILGLVPVIVDAATGNWYTFDLDHVAAAMERE